MSNQHPLLSTPTQTRSLLLVMLSSSPSSAILASPTFIGRDSPPPSPRVTFRPLQAFAASTSTSYSSSEEYASSYLSPRGSPPCLSLYEVLGISSGASSQEIKAAYRRLTRIFHPDVAEIDRKDYSAFEFMKIRDAYSTLSDPKKRADYDRKLLCRSRQLTSPTTSTGFSGYAGRNWETDQCW